MTGRTTTPSVHYPPVLPATPPQPATRYWTRSRGPTRTTCQIITHANGEAASDLLIAAHEAAIAEHGPTARRPVLIHGQFLRSDQVDALKQLGIMPSLFPMHTFYWGDWHRETRYGPELADNISPTGWMRAAYIKFGSHHDAPVAVPGLMRILDATVTQRSTTATSSAQPSAST